MELGCQGVEIDIAGNCVYVWERVRAVVDIQKCPYCTPLFIIGNYSTFFSYIPYVPLAMDRTTTVNHDHL